MGKSTDWIVNPRTFGEHVAYYGAHTAANMATRPNFRKATLAAAATTAGAIKYFSSLKKMAPTKKKRSKSKALAVVAKKDLRNVFKSAKKTKTKETQTRYRPRRSYTQSKSSGFMRSNRKLRKARSAKRGVKFVTERGGMLDTKIAGEAGPTVIVGHTTTPFAYFGKMIWRALILEMAQKSGMRTTSLDSDLFGKANDQLLVNYFPNSMMGTNRLTHVFTVAGGGSINQFADTVYNWWQANASDQYVIDSIRYFPVTQAVGQPHEYHGYEMTCLKYKMRFYVKSTLKIQNRTIEVAENLDADDVSNAPLYGKSYSGPGNGMRSLAFKLSFVGDEDFGDIWKQDTRNTADNQPVREPPPPDLFTHVTKYGKQKIDPGELKTSVLTHSGVKDLNELLQMFIPATLLDTSPYIKMGKYNILILEKMLTVGNATDDLGIKIGYEVNNFFQFTLLPRYQNTSVLHSRLGNVNTTVQ